MSDLELTDHDDTTESPSAGSEAWKALVARALEHFERDGLTGFEAFCAEHPLHATELRRRLDTLLHVGLMQSVPVRDAPRTLGRFEIRRVLGSGGMGVVYLARDDKLGRDVALKTLPPHLYGSARTHERFAREVRAVAQLRHPGIVAIYELDQAEGVPFFSMEYVPGRTLATALEELRALAIAPNGLTIAHLRQALNASTAGALRGRSYVEAACRIAIDVARALEHAHERGVIHRDVKPANVLISADGRAHLFDFGLARFVSEDKLTLTGDFVGTYSYMSPEQIGEHGADLDERTDVYSLGATLYELLALRPPFVAASTQQVLRQIASKEPTPLRKLNAAVPADLETICATALEKDRSRRYGSCREFAEDLQRLLELRPITARPAGAWTRSHRFVRRNPATAAAIGLAAVLLCGTPIGLAISNHLTGIERDNARDASRTSERMLEFMVSLLGLADEEELGPDVPARELLEQGSHWLLEEGQLADQPRIRARLMTTLGSIFWMMSEPERADALLTKSLEIQTAVLGPRHVERARTLNYLGNLRRTQGRDRDAEPLLREALDIFRSENGDAHPDTVMVLGNLGTLLGELGRYDEAERACRDVIELQNEIPATAASDRVGATLGLASVLFNAGRRDEAEPILLDARRRAGQLERPDMLVARCDIALGRLANERGQPAAAEEHFQAAANVFERVLGDRSIFTAVALRWLGDAQAQQGAMQEAHATLERAVTSARSAGGLDHVELGLAEWAFGLTCNEPEHREQSASSVRDAARILSRPESHSTHLQVGLIHSLLADKLLGAECPTDASVAAERAVAELEMPDGPASTALGVALIYAGLGHTRAGRHAEGEAYLRRGIDVLADCDDAPPWSRVSSLGALGECLLRQARFAEAEPLLLAAFGALPEASRIHPALRRRTYLRLIELYSARGDEPQAESWSAELAQAGL